VTPESSMRSRVRDILRRETEQSRAILVYDQFHAGNLLVQSRLGSMTASSARITSRTL